MLLFYSFTVVLQPAPRWTKISSAADGFSMDSTSHHGGKVPRKLASHLLEAVWQECNVNRAQKYDNFFLSFYFWFMKRNLRHMCHHVCFSTYYRRKFSAIASGLCEEEMDKAGVWDFVERYQRMQCNCSRFKLHLCFSALYQIIWIINIPILTVVFVATKY